MHRLACLLVVAALRSVAAAPADDAVHWLPGFGRPPSPHYAGFLDASAAEPGTSLFYWYAQSSAADWASRPVLCWFNGGPGSSSVLGMLQEQGPLLIDRRGQLLENPWAWTRVANFFVIESPAGVGHSYCAATAKGRPCAATDTSTAHAAHAALRSFFVKFPELASNRLFIAGESYAGVYVPTLARAVLAGNRRGDTPRINLWGIAVGDPCTDNDSQSDSLDVLWCGCGRT